MGNSRATPSFSPFPQKQKDLGELAEHKYGYRVLAQLLHPWCGRYLPPQLAAVARPPTKEYSAEAMRRPQHDVVAAAKAAEEAEEEQQGADGAAESDDDDEVRAEAWEGVGGWGGAGILGRSMPQVVCCCAALRCAAHVVCAHLACSQAAPVPACLITTCVRSFPSSSLPAQGGAGARPTSGPLGVSKKDPDVRRRELLSGGAPASLAAALCTLCAQQAGQLVRSQHGSDILVEVCRGGEGGLLMECLGADAEQQLAAVHDALVAAVAGGEQAAEEEEEEAEEGGQQQQEPVLPHFFGSRALRRLVLASNDGGAAGEAAAAFAGKLWQGAVAGSCKQWVDTHAAKVLAALLHCGDAATKQAAAKELKPLVKGSLDEWADRLTSKKGEGKQQQQQRGKQQAAKQQAGKQPGRQAGKQQPKQQPKQQAQPAQQQPSAKKRKQK